MKLLVSHASPYARKCRITLIEKGITGVEQIQVNPLEEPEKLNHINPLGKIPCLIYDEGKTLFDSPVICAYFNQIGDGPQLMPVEGAKHWAMRRQEAIIDGILDSALGLVQEYRKPEEKHFDMWIQRWGCAIDRSLSQLNNELDQISGDISTAQIGLGSAIGYLQFRLSQRDWIRPYPELSAWYDEFSSRPSMLRTKPE